MIFIVNNGLLNGHSLNDVNSVFSTNSTTPLIASRHKHFFDKHIQNVLIIPNGKIVFKKNIGQGHYGTVHLGEIHYNDKMLLPEAVAIKTIAQTRLQNDSQYTADFRREIKIMMVSWFIFVFYFLLKI